jgi:hypothetical protein
MMIVNAWERALGLWRPRARERLPAASDDGVHAPDATPDEVEPARPGPGFDGRVRRPRRGPLTALDADGGSQSGL